MKSKPLEQRITFFRKAVLNNMKTFKGGNPLNIVKKKNFKEDTQVMQLFFNMKIFKYISHVMLKILKGGSLWNKTL